MENEKLIEQAKAKDPDAFTALVQLHMKSMYCVAIAILINDEDAADAIQETILACWEKISSLRKNEYFKTWLIRILINKCYDIRNQNLKCTSLEDVPEEGAEDRYNLEIKEALSQLDEKYRIVVALHYFEGYKTAEIAKILKIPKSTVRTRLQRAREKLRDYLQDENESVRKITVYKEQTQCE